MGEHVRPGDPFRWWVLGATAMGMFAYGYGLCNVTISFLCTCVHHSESVSANKQIAYDNPVALQRQLQDTYDLSNVKYNLLYSVYAFPNMVLPAIAGVMSDKIGYDWLVIFFFGLMVLGHGMFVFGLYIDGLFPVLIAARLVFGIGAESHALVETPLIYDYFKGKELAFALALHLSMARAGSSVNDVCTYYAYTNSPLGGTKEDRILFATSIGVAVLLFFWICIIFLVLVHRIKVRRNKYMAKMLKKQKRKQQRAEQSVYSTRSVGSRDVTISKWESQGPAFEERSISNIDAIGAIQNNIANRSGGSNYSSFTAPLIRDDLDSDLMSNPLPLPKSQMISGTISRSPSTSLSPLEGDDGRKRVRMIDDSPPRGDTDGHGVVVVDDESQLQLSRKESIHSQATSAMSGMKLSDIKEFDIVFWLLVWNCAIMYAIVLAWMNIGSDFLQTTYGYSHGKANALLTIPYSLAGVLQPIWGFISDKVGLRSQFLFVSSLLFCAAHYMFGWVRLDGDPLWLPIAALTTLGMGYSVFTAVIWPCYPLVVPPRAIGTAYGIPTSGYNLILTIYYVLVGVLTSSGDGTDKYLNVQWLLGVTSASTVLTSIWLLLMDKRTGWRLYPPASAEYDELDAF